MKCSDKTQIEGVLLEAVDSVQPDLNMENSAAEKLNCTQSELGMIILLCLSFMS